MKTKSFIYSRIFLISVLFIQLTIHSCSKKDDIALSEISDSEKMLLFNSADDYFSKINKVQSMSTQELKAYEDENGYKSFGRIADELLEKIDSIEFKSIEELTAFVAENSSYLVIKENEQGFTEIESLFANNPNRYLIINGYQYFKINKQIFKIFEEGLIVANQSNFSKLKEMSSFKNFDNNQNSEFKSMPIFAEYSKKNNKTADQTYNCGTFREGNKTNGRYRVKLTLSIDYIWIENPQGDLIQYNVRANVRSYISTLGIWTRTKKTHSANLNIALDTYNGTVWSRSSFNFNYPGSLGMSIDHSFSGGVLPSHEFSLSDYHFGAFDCWGKTPDTDKVILQCNTSLL